MAYAPGELQKLILIFRANYDGICFYCGVRLLTKKESKRHPTRAQSWTIDHVVPLCKMGGDDKANKANCCFRCNQVKGKKDLDGFRTVRYGSVDVEFFFEYDMRQRGLLNDLEMRFAELALQNLESVEESAFPVKTFYDRLAD